MRLVLLLNVPKKAPFLRLTSFFSESRIGGEVVSDLHLLGLLVSIQDLRESIYPCSTLQDKTSDVLDTIFRLIHCFYFQEVLVVLRARTLMTTVNRPS